MNKSINRIAKWDNIKFVLIFLVVLGHFCEIYTGESINLKRIFFFIYIFHMPAFLFLSGVFSKRNIDQKRFSNIFSYLILFYVAKILLYIAKFIANKPHEFSLFTEKGLPWYALTLFAFNLMTIFLKRFDKKYMLIALIILACFTGYDSDVSDFLALSRIVVYYPFFFAGYCLDRQKLLEFISRKWVKIASAAVLLVIMAIVYFKIDEIYWLRPLLTGRNPFSKLEQYVQYGGLMRLVYYPIVALIVIAVMSLIPALQGITMKIGSRSLQIYVLHYCFIYLLYGFFDIDKMMKTIFPFSPYLMILPITILLILFCSLNIFEKFFKFILYPKEQNIGQK